MAAATTTRVANSPGKGSGLFAAAHLESASSILSIPSPLAALPDNVHLDETCAWCLAWKPSASPLAYYTSATTPLLRCAGCKTVHYCDKVCQREDFKAGHKTECKIYARLHPRVLPATVRVTIRIMLTTHASDLTRVNPLQSHITAFSAREDFSDICLMAKGAQAYSNTPLSEAGVLELYCRVLLNTLTATTPTLDSVGLYFDPQISLVNHSCDPNAAIVFEGRTLTLRSMRTIVAGEEVTIAYVDPTMPTWVRQRELENRWFFACACERCRHDGAGVPETYSCATCSSTIEPSDDTLECPTCDDARVHSVRHIRSLETLGLDAATPEDIKCALTALYRTTLFPPYRQPLPALHEATLHSLLASQQFTEALPHQLLLYTRSDPKHYAPHHPVRTCRGFVLAALLMEVSRAPPVGQWTDLDVDWAKAIWAVLSATEKGVAMSHGLESAFKRVVSLKMEEVRSELEKAGVAWAINMKDGARVEGLEKELVKVEKVVDELVKGLMRREDKGKGRAIEV